MLLGDFQITSSYKSLGDWQPEVLMISQHWNSQVGSPKKKTVSQVEDVPPNSRNMFFRLKTLPNITYLGHHGNFHNEIWDDVMDAFLGGNYSATFPNFGSSLGRITSLEKPPRETARMAVRGVSRWVVRREGAPFPAFRSHIWDSQDPTGRVPRNQEKNMEKPYVFETHPCYGHR